MNQQSLTTQAGTDCRGRQSVHNGVALLPIGQPGSEPPHWLGNESGMVERQKTGVPAGATPAVARPLSPPPFLSGTLQASVGLQLLAQTPERLLALDEQRQTSVCKRLTNSGEPNKTKVRSVSQALEATPFLTMDQRFKVLPTASLPNIEIADALTELRECGTIKAFFEVVTTAGRVFTVEYP